MTRSAEHWCGLALRGPAMVGSLAVSTPGLIYASASSRPDAPTPTGGWSLREQSSVPGSRRLRLQSPNASLDLEYPIPAAEVASGSGPVHLAAPGCFVLHAPVDAAQWSTIAAARPELVVLGNARSLFGEADTFVRCVGELRRNVGPSPLLWAPRVALPHRLALLAYLGVDLLDTTEGAIRSVSGEYLDPTLGSLAERPAGEERSCPCPSCASDPPGPLRDHAEWLYTQELARVRWAIRTGRLRELVETRLPAEPGMAEVLRYADRELWDLLDDRADLIGPPNVTYVLRESHRRPEVRRFRERLLARYTPPPSKQILLLVPCSRTKPYRNSRSHRRFASAWEGMTGAERIHIVSVTSPLGLVPRELEDAYPARHYDIPVTGEWEEGERSAVVEALRHLLRTGRYAAVLVHLDPVEYAFVYDALAGNRRTVRTLDDSGSTRAEAIARLRLAVGESLSSLEPAPGGPLQVVREDLEAVAAFQFGTEASKLLFKPPVRLMGRPWFQRVTDGHGVDLATWREERGWFHLTVPGAERMLPAHPPQVEVAGGFELTGDLFAPGVAGVDPSVRAGDSVLLVRHGRLLGVGEALLPAGLMKGLPRGAAVRVRHRAHSREADAGGDTHLTEEPSLSAGRSSSG